jgi:DNA-binding NarL/FixJ family response regulator
MEALAVARAEKPDLILSDVLMPTMDGYEFVRQLRNDPLISRTKVVFCTAVYHVEQARALAAACGVLYTICKPAEPDTVIQIVEAALSKAPPVPPALPEEFDREHLKLLAKFIMKNVRPYWMLDLSNSSGPTQKRVRSKLTKERAPAKANHRFERDGLAE